MPNRFPLLCRLALILGLAAAGHGLVAIGLKFQGLALVLLAFVLWRKLKRRRVTTDHGSARTATTLQVERAGLHSEAPDAVLLARSLAGPPPLAEAIGGLLSPGVRSDAACRGVLGAIYGGRWNTEKLIRTRNNIHISTFSPAGGGKGVAAMIPNLLSYQGNCVIADVKGELFAKTAEHRRKRFGKKIYRLEPFPVDPERPAGDTLNPFDFLDETKPDFIDRVRAFANPLIIRQEEEKQPHFNDMAENMLVALSAFVCTFQKHRERRNLNTVMHCASSKDVFSQAIGHMRQTDACHGFLKRQAGKLTFPAAEEMGSIFSTFARQTEFLDSPVVARNVATSSFDPMELKTGNADLYLILPHDMLISHNRLMRLWLNTVMSRVTSGEPDESRTVLWLLDEAAHFLQGMQAIENACTLYRGYGMRLWFVFQSLEQLKSTFGEKKAGTILDNIGTQQYFAINSLATAKEVSERIGTTTVATESANTSSGTSRSSSMQGQQDSSSTGSGVNYAEIGRRLLLPEEILTLPEDIMLIFHRNLPVIPARLVKYFEAPEFKNGGTASPRRLGRAEGLLACLTLFLGMLIAAIGADVSAMPVRPAVAAVRRTGMSMVPQRRQPAPLLRQVPPARQQPRPRPRSRRRGPSGYLIRIQ